MYFNFQMQLIANLPCLLFSFCLFIGNPSLRRNQRDFQDGLQLINFSGCAQPSFFAGTETRNEKLQTEPFVQQEGIYTALCPQSMMVIIHKMKRKLPNVVQMWFSKNKKIEWIVFQPIKLSISQTPDEDNSRTYASLDESKREAKDIEYENLKPAHGYVNASPSENVWKAMVGCWLDILR